MTPDVLDIFSYGFMHRALLAGLLIGVVAPVIGTFLVVRRYAIMADTLAHVSLVGVAASILGGLTNPVYGAAAVSVLASIGIEELRARGRLFGESVLALFLSGSLAIAVILVGLGRGLNVNFTQYLFGSITTVTWTNVAVLAGFVTLALMLVAVTYRRLFLIAFDEDLARAGGIRVRVYNAMQMALAALAISLSIQIVGALLIGALMVIPVLAAMQLRRSFLATMVIAVGFSLVSVAVGLVASVALDLASGGTIVLTALILFMASLLVGKKQT
ncbi:metal ABC transporter permease [Patescibacteria group bacterium]|nr:metal ABC transporter permease [Patescibacteria group bacterium]MBU1448807.1 metal ABC transporter permease [Patescibacteria group bacterium]MBU2613609.1 metal ABC transporter permease [Patescibacteria group bacterium]